MAQAGRGTIVWRLSSHPHRRRRSGWQTERLDWFVLSYKVQVKPPEMGLGMLSVGVVGTGYVGLVTGTCLSELGHDVVCIDNDTNKVDQLRRGEVSIHEPGLPELVRANVGRGTLRFATQIDDAVVHRFDVLFIAVGTPSDGNGGGANLDYVYAAVEEAAAAMAKRPESPGDFTVIVTKSTVPAGTSWKMANIVGGTAASTFRGRIQSRIPARGKRDQGLHGARPNRHRGGIGAGTRHA